MRPSVIPLRYDMWSLLFREIVLLIEISETLFTHLCCLLTIFLTGFMLFFYVFYVWVLGLEIEFSVWCQPGRLSVNNNLMIPLQCSIQGNFFIDQISHILLAHLFFLLIIYFIYLSQADRWPHYFIILQLRPKVKIDQYLIRYTNK